MLWAGGWLIWTIDAWGWCRTEKETQQSVTPPLSCGSEEWWGALREVFHQGCSKLLLSKAMLSGCPSACETFSHLCHYVTMVTVDFHSHCEHKCEDGISWLPPFFRTVTHIAICGLKYVGFEADWSLHLGHITGKMARKLSVTRKSNGIKEMVILYIYQDFVKLCAVCFFLWVCTCGNASATEARREHQV